ncbi:MAG: site-specific DNA-methyltransferase [Solirubrobacteraceae bacterium]
MRTYVRPHMRTRRAGTGRAARKPRRRVIGENQRGGEDAQQTSREHERPSLARPGHEGARAPGGAGHVSALGGPEGLPNSDAGAPHAGAPPPAVVRRLQREPGNRGRQPSGHGLAPVAIPGRDRRGVSRSPYNTGKKDFAYSDARFHDPNADADDMVYVNNEDGGRHTKWLNYLGPRLWLVWQLLAEHGVCFVSISDIEFFRLGMLMDEIFGERNRLGVVVWRQMADNNPTRVAVGHEYILCYAKNIDDVPSVWTGHSDAREWLLDTFETIKAQTSDLAEQQRLYQAAIKEHVAAYKRSVEAGDSVALIELGELDRYKFVDERGPYAAVRDTAVHAGASHPGLIYDIIHPNGKVCKKPGSGYRFREERMRQFQAEGRLIFGRDHTQLVQLKKYLREISPPLRGVIDLDSRKGGAVLKKLLPKKAKSFKNPKPVELMMQLVEFAGESDALVLDPFAGSGTTGHAVMRLNARDGGTRRFILIEEGSREERYCRTILAPRLKAAIKQEELPGGFVFESAGRRLNRNAILELEREAIANLIVHTDSTGKGRGITRVAGEHVIGHNGRQEAICLCWNGRTKSAITRDVLVTMFDEAKALGLRRPLRAYGATCEVGETDSFRFCQIPDEILAALQIADDDGALAGDPDAVEILETALLGAADAGG